MQTLKTDFKINLITVKMLLKDNLVEKLNKKVVNFFYY